MAALVGGAYAVVGLALAGRELLAQLWPAVVGRDVVGDVPHPDHAWVTAALLGIGLAVGLLGMLVGTLRGRTWMARAAAAGLAVVAVVVAVGALAPDGGPRCSETTYSGTLTCASERVATTFDVSVLALPALLAGLALAVPVRRSAG